MSVSEEYQPIDLRDIDKYPKFYFGGFWRRLGAMVIDLFILVAFSFLLIYLLEGGLSLSKLSNPSITDTLRGNLITAIYAIAFIAVRGATPGKIISKLKVVTLEGKQVSWLQSIIRYSPSLIFSVLIILSQVMFSATILENGQKVPSAVETAVYLVMYIWFIACAIVLVRHPQRRTLHDLLAGTAVIKV